MIKKLFIITFCCLLALPVVFQFTDIVPSTRLFGVENQKVKFQFNWKKLFNKRQQDSLELALKRKNELFPYLIKTENELNYQVFRQMGLGIGLGLGRAKNGELFEKSYLGSVNRDLNINPKQIKVLGKRLKILQEALKEKGGNLLVFLTPNKLSLRPEIVPDNLKIIGAGNRPEAYSLVKEQLINRSIPNFDAQEFFSNFKNHSPAIFPTGGTHLSEYASCLATREIINQLNILNPKFQIPKLNCELTGKLAPPITNDIDIARLANFWSFNQFIQPVERTRDSRSFKIPFENKPKVLLVGTSFVWNILQMFDDNSYFKLRDFIYYFKTKYLKSGKVVHDFQCDAKVFEDYILSFDYVILEANHAFANQLGHGLMNCLLKYKRAKLLLNQ